MSELPSVSYHPALRSGGLVRAGLPHHTYRYQLPLAGALDHHLHAHRSDWTAHRLADRKGTSPMVRLEAQK